MNNHKTWRRMSRPTKPGRAVAWRAQFVGLVKLGARIRRFSRSPGREAERPAAVKCSVFLVITCRPCRRAVCGNKAIADQYNLAGLLRFGRKFAPDVAGFEINRQDAVGVMGLSPEEGSYCLVGYQTRQWICAMADSGATITPVKKQPAGFRRRKLSAVVRKAIISYYNEDEKQEIMRAAKKLGASVSSFVASAALAEARRTNRKP